MKKKKTVLAIAVLVLLIVLGVVVVILKQRSNGDFSEVNPAISSFATGGDIDDGSRKYDRFGSSGGYTPLLLNVSSCEKGKDSAYFGSGHTEFLVKGKNDGRCTFEYGTQIENPSWDGKLDTECSVPIDQVISLTVGDQGIDFTQIKQYCSSSNENGSNFVN
jgi:hypothetical protein